MAKQFAKAAPKKPRPFFVNLRGLAAFWCGLPLALDQEGFMDFAELRALVSRALEKLVERDKDLFHIDASEWAIAHRFAVYLEGELPQDWNVDCEYNRQGSEGKAKALGDGGRIRPDIIIHHRTRLQLEHNLLVIELKKYEDDADLIKALEYTKNPDGEQHFQYQYGLALSILDGPKLTWYAGGNKL